MKAKSTHQEILLVTGSGFFSQQWCKNEDFAADENLSDQEKLEEACWNGLLQEMLPEICSHDKRNEKLYLWEIRQGSSFLELELGNCFEEKDNYFSIDPYSFLATKSEN
jgi:hypothetical protein